MQVKKVTVEELKKVGEIAKSCFDDYSPSDYLKMSTDPNYVFVVAVEKGLIVGFLIFLHIDTKLEVIKIATSKKFLRQGVGSGLIDFMIEYGKERGHEGIILEVNENNNSAINLYKKKGFNPIHVRKKYYHNTDDGIIMELLF